MLKVEIKRWLGKRWMVDRLIQRVSKACFFKAFLSNIFPSNSNLKCERKVYTLKKY